MESYSNRDHTQLDAGHLTDEQFSDLLLGNVAAPVTEHLEICAQCAEEAQRLSGALGSFEQQSRLWAERRAACQPGRTPAREPVAGWLVRPQAWTAAALALALAVGVGLARRGAGPTVAPQKAAAVATPQGTAGILPGVTSAVTPATLKADNELLSAINGELSEDPTSSASTYGLTISHHTGRGRTAKGISN